MFEPLRRFPLLVILALIASAAMLVPAIHAYWQDDLEIARAFVFYSGVWAVLSIMTGIASSGRGHLMDLPRQVFLLLVAYFMLPAILAGPLAQSVPSITFAQAYFEALSSLTTTGASVFEDPRAIPETLHLWRAMIAWLGGLLILVAAVAVLGPLQMGGFEIEQAATRMSAEQHRGVGSASEERNLRLYRAAINILPIYFVLTLALALVLVSLGDRAIVGLIHAMSVLSTSGITSLAHFGDAESGRAGEVAVFFFLLLAITRRATSSPRWDRLRDTMDPEMRLAMTCILALTFLLFFRHFLGAIEVSGQENFGAALTALWGAMFSVLSFLSTTGFESRDWAAMQNWSGLDTPGTILLGLCTMGGGIATTAGGVKLLRVYALYKHGVREMERLIHPNSVGGAGITARNIRKRGAQIAWVFLMLFLVGMSVVMMALTALGQTFDDAMALSIAALTTTGPAAAALNPEIAYGNLDTATQAVLCIAMVFGRLELLVLISVLNPSYWRN